MARFFWQQLDIFWAHSRRKNGRITQILQERKFESQRRIFSNLTMGKECIFCNIYSGKAPSNTLYKDDEVIVFSDIRPAAAHHYLVVPKAHLTNAKCLKNEHISLIEKLVALGKRVLDEKLADSNDVRLGFHWPPFNSISHLHLHVISPASQMSFYNKIAFSQTNMWFVSPQYVIQRLSRL